MLNFDVKRKINTLRDILVGKVPDPKAQVEQITIALIYKFMDDMDLEGAEWGERIFFTDDYKKYAWTEIMTSENGAQQRADFYREGIEKMALNPQLPQLFRDIFRGAYIPYRDPETLNMFLKEINEFSYDNSEDLGNAFEYLLSIMGSQGDAGQFRTPRHIIDMIVKIIDPKKTESILDPACGTAGFLISAYKHIVEHNKNKDGNIELSADDRKFMTENFAGYDISPDMVRLARVNMYLHKFIKPQINEYDTLSSEEKWNDTYDVILANPPFMTPKGGIIPHKRYRVQAKRAEVLFVDYIAEHLSLTGRAGIIVPEGIVFQSANAYKQLREYLIKDNLLYGVISLPAGVFQPYSGVKTSILLLDKIFAKQTDNIIFAKMNNDGFDLGAQRREIKGSEIDDIINLIDDYKNGKDVSNNKLITIATKEKVAEQDYILVGERYKEVVAVSSDYPMVELGEVCEVISGYAFKGNELQEIQTDNAFPVIKIGNLINKSMIDLSDVQYYEYNNSLEKFLIEKEDLLLAMTGATVGKVSVSCENKLLLNQRVANIRASGINTLYLRYLLFNADFYNYCQLNAGGGAQGNISPNTIKTYKIPLPPLSVQEEIVAEIESYQKIIDGAKQVVENYKPTIKIDPTWEMVKLGDVCKFIRGPFGGSLKKEIFVENGYLVYEQYHAINNDFEFGRYFITEDKFNEMKRFEVISSDILISCSGTMGKIAIVPPNNKKGIINQALLKLTIDETTTPLFVKIYLESSNIQQKYFSNQAGAAIQNVVSVKELKEIQFPKVELKTQQQIIAEINEEMAIVAQNKRLIEIFEQKIKNKISGVWGE